MKQTQQNGFTLIELMVVVAIIGILAAIAYPSYTDSVRKSRRADAMGALLGFANAMERSFTQFNTYCDTATTSAGAVVAGDTCGNAAITDTGIPTGAIYAPPAATAVNYTFTISAATAFTYTLTATRVAGSGQANDRCGDLTLTNTGAKGFTGAGLTRADCW